MKGGRRPRRLSSEERRRQLIAAASAVVAEQGLAEFWLEEIAVRADVTRPLLYHYFPRGRADVIKAVVDDACEALMADWLDDERLPLLEWMNAKAARFLAHAITHSDVWRVYRMARSAAEPDISSRVRDHVEAVARVIASKRTGPSTQSPTLHLVLVAFIAFAEAVLDGAAEIKAEPEQLGRLLTETLTTVVRSADSDLPLPHGAPIPHGAPNFSRDRNVEPGA